MLKKLENFLYKKRENKEILFIFFLILSFDYFRTDITHLIISFLSPELIPKADILIGEITKENITYGIFGSIVITFFYVVYEEALFRLPIAIFIRKNFSFIIKLLLILLLNIVFAITHFYTSTEAKFIVPILQQGIGGILMSILFILSGANVGKYFKALSIVVFYHFIWNMSTIIYYM
jgi:hypothetical protein